MRKKVQAMNSFYAVARMGAALSCMALLAACAGQTRTAYGLGDPADPQARVPRTAYRNVTAGYQPIRPAAAGDWREMNRRVTPQQGR